MAEAFVYDHLRTPRGKGKAVGSLHEVKPVDLVVGLLDEIQARNPALDPTASTTSCSASSRRSATRAATSPRPPRSRPGYPETVAGVQLNRFCASGLEAVNQAAARVRGGFEDLILAGGVESMSRVPMGSDGGAWACRPGHRADHRLRAAGHRRRPDRHPRGLDPRRRRRVRRRVAPPRRQGLGQRLLRRLGRPGQGPQRRDRARPRRADPPRHQPSRAWPGSSRRFADIGARRRLRRRGAGEVPLGRADRPRPPRRQLLGHRRRRRADGDRHRAGRHRPRPHPAGPDHRRPRSPAPTRRSCSPAPPRPPARRWPRPASRSTTSTCSRSTRRSPPSRCGSCRTWASPTRSPTSTAAPSPWATRSAPPAR